MSAVTSEAPLLLPGLRVKGAIAGRYRVERLLGAGSSGLVVAARHVYLRRRVTLKILTSATARHHEAQRRHLEAAHRAAELRGPHVARIVDTGFTEDGLPFVATERLEGRTLRAELDARGKLPSDEAVRWILQACEGLAEAHAAGIVHAGLKPQNLFLAGEGTATDVHGRDGRVLKVLDFGMAAPVVSAFSSTSEGDASDMDDGAAWFASPAYLAPEQMRDPHGIDARADVWALGVVLHELIAGSLPFSGETVSAMLVAVAYDEPASLAREAPPELARVVRKCLAKDPAARPRDVATLARLLAPFAGADGVALSTRIEAVSAAPVSSARRPREEPAAVTERAGSGALPAPEAPSPGSAASLLASTVVASPDAKSPSSTPTLPSSSTVASVASGEDIEFECRQRGALAVAVVIAGFASLVGLCAALAPKPGLDPEPVDTYAVPAEDLVPLPFVPHSFVAPDRTRDASKRESPPPPNRSNTPVHRPDPSVPAARALARDAPQNNPYATKLRDDGFTHPDLLELGAQPQRIRTAARDHRP